MHIWFSLVGWEDKALGYRRHNVLLRDLRELRYPRCTSIRRACSIPALTQLVMYLSMFPFYHVIDSPASSLLSCFSPASLRYAFVFLWTPAMTAGRPAGAPDLPFGLIFAVFMSMVMVGSGVFEKMIGSGPLER